MPHRRRGVVEFGLATFLGLLLVIQVQRILPLEIDVDRHYPKDALAYVRTNDIHRIFNIYADGGYLIYNGVAPLIDGRGDPFIPTYNGGDDIMGEYAAVLQLREDWRPFLEKHHIQYLLLGKNIPFYRALRHAHGVSVLYEDQEFAVLNYEAAYASNGEALRS